MAWSVVLLTELVITSSSPTVSPIRDYHQLNGQSGRMFDRHTLAILADNLDAPVFWFFYVPKSSIDYNIKGIAGILRSPENLTSINLHPIQ